MKKSRKRKDRGGTPPDRSGVKPGGRTEPTRGAPWGERPWLLIGFFALLNLAFCVVLFDPKLHTGGDSSHYVLLAESILRPGDGYADAMEPGEPVPHTKYPPGFPLLLAPLIALFGRNFPVLKLLTVALTVSSVLVFSVLARERERVGALPWFALSLAFAVNPVVVDYSHWLLSEAAFLFFSLLALLFLQRESTEEGIGKYFWLAVLAIVATYYMRSIGIVFIAAGSLFYLIRRRWRKFLYYNVLGAMLSLPWFIRGQVLGGSATPYIEQFFLRSVYEPEAGQLDLWGMVGRFFANVWIYSSRELPRLLVGSDSLWAGAAVMKGLALVVFAFMVIGFVQAVWKKLGVAEIYFGLSWLAILLFEEVVSDIRYLMPLVPLVLFYVYDGVALVAGRVTSLKKPAIPAIAAVALIATIGVFSQLERMPENIEMLRRYSRGDRYAGYHPVWRSFFVASDWVAANTPPDAVVTMRKPRLVHIWTGRKVVLYPFSTDPDSVLQVIGKTDYVLVDQISGTTGRYLVPAIQKAPERFRVVYQTDEPSTWVLQVLNPPDEP